ncbi:MAG: prolipoprotein diacylglyceryl transferase, partial [Planctomycetaceae bacterium]
GAVSMYFSWKTRDPEADSSKQDLFASLATFVGVPILVYMFLPAGLRTDGIPIFGYGLMMFLGIASGTALAIWNAKKLGLTSDAIMDMSMWLIVPGIVGGRMFYVIQKGMLRGKGLGDGFAAIINLPDGGLVFYGAIIGGLLGFLTYCYRKDLNVLLMGDIVLPSVILGLGFGRIGCFLYGCCYGGMCSLPWAVEFPKNSVPYDAQINTGYLTPDAPHSLPLHPTQIYSSINAFLLAAMLVVYLRRHRPYHGAVLAIGWVIYPIARFTLEFVRNDEPGQFGTPFTISQLISIGLFVTGIIYTIQLVKSRGRMAGPATTMAKSA